MNITPVPVFSIRTRAKEHGQWCPPETKSMGFCLSGKKKKWEQKKTRTSNL